MRSGSDLDGRALTFVPADPPRESRFVSWDRDAGTGLFAAAEPEVEHVVLVVPRGDGVERETVAAVPWSMSEALTAFAGVDTEATASVRWWAAVARLALDLIARGRVVPAVTAAGWDAWRLDPLDPVDHLRLDELVAACPPEAHCLATPDGRRTVSDPGWAARCALDAVADVVVRTAAAPVALGSHLFASAVPTPAEPARPWLAAAFGPLTSSTRFGLRVEHVADRSDDETRGHFEVVPQLRSARDPSLVIDAEELDERSAALRSRLGPSAASELLVAVARAAVWWSPLDALLDHHQVGRFVVDDDELDALLDAADDLEAAGVEVLWPSSFVADLRPRLVATAAAPPAAASTPMLDLGTILDFRWEVLCEGSALTDVELDSLVDAKRPVVWLRGRWVRVDADLVRRLRETPPSVDGPAGLAAALAGELVTADGTAVEVVAEGFVELLRNRLGDLAGLREAEEPPGLAATLRPYQRRGVAWMTDLCRSGLGGVLADDMGLGKTVQVIALHLELTSSSDANAPMLVVCPTSVVGNWAREIGRFAPGIPVRVLAGAHRSVASLAPNEIVIVTYGLMRRLVDDLAEVPWSVVVADEAQSIKNPRARTSRALRRIPARSRLALTGTPVENRLSELWALLDWTTPGLLGSFDHFRTEFASPIERGRDHGRSTRLSLLTRPFMLRRRKTDPAVAPDLPPRTHHDVVTPLSVEQLSMYEALVRESLHRINGSEGATRVGMVFRLLTGLKQIANHPAHYLHETDAPLEARSGKLDATVDLVSAAVDGQERVLVFSQYVEMCTLLRRRFAEAGIHGEVLHGGLSATARDRLVDRFQAGDVPVLVVSLKAGGTGLNLTAATQVIHFDRWWNPAVEDQATDRAWRIGQTRPVVVHRMIAEGTIDERIAEMIERKRSLADHVVGDGGETWIADLDDDQLAELVALREPGSHFRRGVLL